MGWNGSGQKGAAPVQPKVTAKKPSPIRGLVAGAVVVALAVVAYFAFFSGSEKPQAEKSDKGRGRIKEVTPAVVPTNAVPDNVLKPSGRKREPKKLTVDRKSLVSTPNLSSNSLVISYGMVNGKSIFKRPVFKYNSENLICAVIQTRPGTRIIDVPLGPRFEQDFANSVADPIRIEEGDTPEEIELKQTMVDVKAELIQRIKNGENLSDIITAARKDLNKLADYAEGMRHTYAEMCESAQSVEELEAFRKKANTLLEERGIPPIRAHKRGRFAVPDEMRYDYKKPEATPEGTKTDK